MFIVFIVLCLDPCLGDILYLDFNETEGLRFNGIAGTTNCQNDLLNEMNSYGDHHGKADKFSEAVEEEYSESTVMVSSSTVETNKEETNEETSTSLAGFLHLQEQASETAVCNVRARLTPSGPTKTGSMWFLDTLPVTNGFDAYFTFQITDHSKSCSFTKDQYFSVQHHRTCSVHGADGFAFVIQLDEKGPTALGRQAEQMGFGGISNSLAVAFDTWQNQGQDSMHADHISIQSRGVLENDALEEGLLGVPKVTPLADGKIHLVRIAYFPELKGSYFDKLVASEKLIPFLKDNGEQKRIGTLVVWIDDGVANDSPIMAMPINLSLLLSLPEDRAFVGFTSATGRFYEKHEILSFVLCEQGTCEDGVNGQNPNKKRFDTHQQSRYKSEGRNTKTRTFSPGPGFGSVGGAQAFPIKNADPDVSSWRVPMAHHSKGRNVGLALNAAEQTPEKTLY